MMKGRSATQDDITAQLSSDFQKMYNASFNAQNADYTKKLSEYSGTYKFQNKNKDSKKFNPANYETPSKLL